MSARKLLVVGHSHIAALRKAWSADAAQHADVEVAFVALRAEAVLRKGVPNRAHNSLAAGVDRDSVVGELAQAGAGAALTVLCLNGNQHNIRAFSMGDERRGGRRPFAATVRQATREWLELLRPHCPGRVVLLPSPPPVRSEGRIRAQPGPFAELLEKVQLPPPARRLALWQDQCAAMADAAAAAGVPVLELPSTVFDAHGFLAEDCCGSDPTHGNAEYGRRLLAAILAEALGSGPAAAEAPAEAPAPVAGRTGGHPYVALPDRAFWKQSVGERAAGAVDPVSEPRFRIGPGDRVATAGSCFAQHISKRLRAGGFNFLQAEPAEGEPDAAARGYHDFSARYGNIYTARQLLQLFDRAFGYFLPRDRVWARAGGGYCDPFRPRIEPQGHAAEEDVLRDARRHLVAVRRMFKQLDVFVFTLGLTECYASRLDGAVYPLAPGVAGGAYDPGEHEFLNFGVAAVTADLRSFLRKLRLVNPAARVILTVSPVPLVATASERHVLAATTYSKSVLRVAAEEIVAEHAFVEYFPSYEIITGPHARGAYFGTDCRSVTEAGVDHVMRVFMGRMTTGAGDAAPAAPVETGDTLEAQAERLAAAACDEEMLAR